MLHLHYDKTYNRSVRKETRTIPRHNTQENEKEGKANSGYKDRKGWGGVYTARK